MWAAGLATLSAAEAMQADLVQDLHWEDHHFAMTNWFYNDKWSKPATQIDIFAERGYGGVMLSLKDDPNRRKTLPAYLATLKKHNMRLTAIDARFYIEDGTYPQVIKDNLPLLKDTKVVLIPSVGSRKKLDRKDPQAVEMAVKILREIDYQGPLGTMGYAQTGDIPGKLKRAYQAWGKMKNKADRANEKHPHPTDRRDSTLRDLPAGLGRLSRDDCFNASAARAEPADPR